MSGKNKWPLPLSDKWKQWRQLHKSIIQCSLVGVTISANEIIWFLQSVQSFEMGTLAEEMTWKLQDK